MSKKMKITMRTTMTKRTGKIDIFPIKNSSACVFKWGWNTFRVYTGKSSSCHRVKPVPVDINNFDAFHNTPEIIQDRKLMLDGQWPVGRGCEYCKNIEDKGGISDRLYHNNIPGLTPVDFDQGLQVTPSISEIYLHNTCDLACVYCLPEFSSRINQELKNFGPYPIGIQPLAEHPDRDKFFDAYVMWLRQNIHKLSRISILGGEPLLQKEFWQILDLLQDIGHKDLELSIHTNLNSASKTLDQFVSKVKQLTAARLIKRCHVSASIDCWGPQAEFVRWGLNLDRWQRNFEYLISHSWIGISVHQVVTALTIKTAVELQRRVAEYKKTYPRILQEYHLVDSGHEKVYHPAIFGPTFFKTYLDQLLEEFPICSQWDNNARQRLEGIVKLVGNSSVDTVGLQMFQNTMNSIDHRRHTDWKQLWPEIDQFLKENGL